MYEELERAKFEYSTKDFNDLDNPGFTIENSYNPRGMAPEIWFKTEVSSKPKPTVEIEYLIPTVDVDLDGNREDKSYEYNKVGYISQQIIDTEPQQSFDYQMLLTDKIRNFLIGPDRIIGYTSQYLMKGSTLLVCCRMDHLHSHPRMSS